MRCNACDCRDSEILTAGGCPRLDKDDEACLVLRGDEPHDFDDVDAWGAGFGIIAGCAAFVGLLWLIVRVLG